MHSTNSKQKEPSFTPNSTEEAIKEIYLNEEIHNGPLRIIGNTTNGYCIVFGKYRLSPIQKTEQEARQDLYDLQWEIIINLMGAITGQTDALKDRIK